MKQLLSTLTMDVRELTDAEEEFLQMAWQAAASTVALSLVNDEGVRKKEKREDGHEDITDHL